MGVVPFNKQDEYYNEVWQITIAGRLFRRGTTLLSRSRTMKIERSDASLPTQTLGTCDRFRRDSEAFVQDARDKGPMESIIKQIREQRSRGGW